MIELGVNVDHVATLRQARGTNYPSPVEAALMIQQAGAHNITCHLREDRRHIQDEDVYDLAEAIDIPLNFEMAAREEMFKIAWEIRPHTLTLVPEKREELTTEEGLNVVGLSSQSKEWMNKLQAVGCRVSLFVDANLAMIDAASLLDVTDLEFHTGFFADAKNKDAAQEEKLKIIEALFYAHEKKITCHLGHGLNLKNLSSWCGQALPIKSVQIGHALISDAVYLGLEQATKDYLSLLA